MKTKEYMVEDMVIYLVKNNKAVPYGSQGMVVATKEDNEDGFKLRSDELIVDFGSEDDYLLKTRKQYIKHKENINES